MADKKTALLGLWKQVEGSMNAAGLSPVKAEKSGDVLTNDGTHDVLSYAGEAGEVRLEYANGVLDIIGSNGEETKSLGTLLFEAESDDWGVKDIRSAANEVGETVADFFGTTFVTAGSSEKAQKTKNAKAAEAAAAAPAPKKKKTKNPEMNSGVMNMRTPTRSNPPTSSTVSRPSSPSTPERPTRTRRDTARSSPRNICRRTRNSSRTSCWPSAWRTRTI